MKKLTSFEQHKFFLWRLNNKIIENNQTEGINIPDNYTDDELYAFMQEYYNENETI